MCNDSGEDLFTTQSSFRTVDTQDADLAATNLFEDSAEMLPDTAFPEEVVYYDFSESARKEHEMAKPAEEVLEKGLPCNDAATDLLNDSDVDKVCNTSCLLYNVS